MKEETKPGRIESRRVYTGKVISLDVDTVRFPDGSIGELEMIRHPGASAVVPFLSDPRGNDPQVLMIRQYRYAADGYLYEIPAGRLNPGENPRDCAARELIEETGFAANRLEKIAKCYAIPGSGDEVMHFYFAFDLQERQQSLDVGEVISEVRVFSLAEIEAMIDCGQIRDAKTLIGLFYALRRNARANRSGAFQTV